MGACFMCKKDAEVELTRPSDDRKGVQTTFFCSLQCVYDHLRPLTPRDRAFIRSFASQIQWGGYVDAKGEDATHGKHWEAVDWFHEACEILGVPRDHIFPKTPRHGGDYDWREFESPEKVREDAK